MHGIVGLLVLIWFNRSHLMLHKNGYIWRGTNIRNGFGEHTNFTGEFRLLLFLSSIHSTMLPVQSYLFLIHTVQWENCSHFNRNSSLVIIVRIWSINKKNRNKSPWVMSILVGWFCLIWSWLFILNSIRICISSTNSTSTLAPIDH